MIQNPYAKKRPRPSGWKSSTCSSTSAQQVNSSSANHRALETLGSSRRNLQTCGIKRNLQHKVKEIIETGDNDGIQNKSNDRRNDDESDPSVHVTTNNVENVLKVDATADVTANVYSKLDHDGSQKTQLDPYKKDISNNLAKNIACSSAKRSLSIPSSNICPSRQKINPYRNQGIIRVSNKHSLRNTNPNPQSIGMNGRGFPEKQSSAALVQSSMERNRPRLRESCVLKRSEMSESVTGKSHVNFHSSMASIRPSCWQLQTSSLDMTSQPFTDKSKNASLCGEGKCRVQPLPSSVGKNISKPHNNKTEDMNDQLPRELFYTRDEVKPIQDGYRMLLIKNAKLSEPLKNGWTLFPHQKKAIIRALSMRRMILALDMGLGKTLIGTVWCKAFKDTFGQSKLKVYVICPVSLKEEWKRTAERSVGLDVDGDRWNKSNAKNRKSTKKNKTEDRNRSDVSEESFVKNSDTKMKMTICSWAKVPKVVEPHIEHFVVCCDEAHAMQSTQSQRTKDILKLVSDDRCVGVLLLTGTPMKNGKPGNLFPLLKAVRHPFGRNQKAFEAHFCNGMLKNFGRGLQWDASGASNLDQLKRKVASNLLHMTKEQCLTELPPMTTILHDVPVSSRYQVQYEESIKYLAVVQANSSDMREEAVLGAVQRLRVVCAHAKVEATVEMARTILNKEPAVVIFTYFAQVAKNVYSKLESNGWPCCLLTGETPQNKRQELVDKFQSGLSSVFVCTFGAGGVGLTLTAASSIILLDRPWTPGETRQAEDRIRRIGQLKKCTSYWMRSFELDKQIDGMLEFKKQTTDAVLDRKENQKPISGPSGKISINRLVHKFILAESRKNL